MEEEKITKRKRKIGATEATDDAVNEGEKAKIARKKTPADLDLAEENVADGRWQKVAGIMFLLFSVILLVAFSSYLFTLAEDQSDVAQGAGLLLEQNTEVKNALGRFGAWLADLMIDHLFGLSSFCFIVISFVVGFNLLVQKQVFPILKISLYAFFSMIWLSATLAFANFLIYPQSVLSWGGAFGNYLTGESGYLTGLVSIIGVAALLVATALSFAVIAFNINFDFLLGKSNVSTDESTAVDSTLGATIPTYRDESENIFGKDNIVEELQSANVPVDEAIEEEEIAPIEEEAIDMEMTVINVDKTDEVLSSGLALEVEEVMEEEVSTKNLGSIGTTFDPTLDLSDYKYPGLELLEEHGSDKVKIDAEELERNKNQIISTLNNYQIEISKIKATVGPTVTLYEIVPAPGVRISKIKNLEDDIALSLAALGIRIIAPIPGKGTIGIEVPNANKEVVSMRSLLASDKFQNTTADLPICLGKSISNEIYVADLSKMPHLLMAGATGQGKSVGINAILVSLLYKKHPSQLKFILVDPKKVELSLYEALEKHFLAKLPGEEDAIITDTKKVVTTLNALCVEMDDRYNLLKKASCRNLKEYNHKFLNRQLNPQNGHKFLPYIVLVVDEFADLIMTAGKEVEMPIARLAQLARAIGIHLILATQRPSVNIITGTIKANFPARIAFKTTSKIDSRTILDQGGSEQLIGRGDMLLSMGSDMIRLQCGFVDTPEVELVRDFIAKQQGYASAFELPEYIDPNSKESGDEFYIDGERDDLFEDAARVIVQNQMGSTSLIQRRLKLGYNRAGRLMDQLQEAGIVGDNMGTKAREVKFKTESELEQYLQKLKEQ